MIVIGNDHAGTALKNHIVEWFKANKIDYLDVGCFEGEKCDYPVAAKNACDEIISGKAENVITSYSIHYTKLYEILPM